MSEVGRNDVTQFLARIGAGETAAAEELLPLIYEELRRLAHARMAHEPPGRTLQPTALVHEAYLRLVGSGASHWRNRGHFFGAAALAMRRILVERARRRKCQQAGDAGFRADEAVPDLPIAEPREDILQLEAAIRELEADDPLKGQIVNLRYFVGLTTEEAAEMLNVSVSTIEREWRYIRAWLFRRLSG